MSKILEFDTLNEYDVTSPISGSTTSEFVFDTADCEEMTVPKKKFEDAVKPGHRLHIALTSGNKKYAITCMIEKVEEIASYDFTGILWPATDEED